MATYHHTETHPDNDCHVIAECRCGWQTRHTSYEAARAAANRHEDDES